MTSALQEECFFFYQYFFLNFQHQEGVFGDVRQHQWGEEKWNGSGFDFFFWKRRTPSTKTVFVSLGVIESLYDLAVPEDCKRK